MTDIIHCFDCKHFKGKYNGWCKNPAYQKSVRVAAVDYCDKAEKK